MIKLFVDALSVQRARRVIRPDLVAIVRQVLGKIASSRE